MILVLRRLSTMIRIYKGNGVIKMTEKRYRVDTGTIIDNTTGDVLSPTKAKNRLNAYEEQITELKKQPKTDRLQKKDELLNKTLQVNSNLTKQIHQRDKQIQDIKNTLQTLMDNERTRLGYNALKQAYEAIQ